MQDFFSIERFKNYFYHQAFLFYKTWMLGLGAIGGSLLLLMLLEVFVGGAYNYSRFIGFAWVAFFLFGFFFSSGAFNDIHKPAKSIFYMTLPASTFEKFFTVWLITAPLFGIFALAAMCILSVIGSLLNLVGTGGWEIFNPLNTIYLQVIAHYLVWQTIFMAGSIYFSSRHFLKTFFSMILFGFGFYFWLIILSTLFFGWDFIMIEGVSVEYNGEEMTGDIRMDELEDSVAEKLNFLGELISNITRIIYWAILGPFFLVFGYYRLKDHEA